MVTPVAIIQNEPLSTLQLVGCDPPSDTAWLVTSCKEIFVDGIDLKSVRAGLEKSIHILARQFAIRVCGYRNMLMAGITSAPFCCSFEDHLAW